MSTREMLIDEMNETRDRVNDLVAWARSRIERCRIDEAKFGYGNIAIEAAQERRTLQTVLERLGKSTDKGG